MNIKIDVQCLNTVGNYGESAPKTSIFNLKYSIVNLILSSFIKPSNTIKDFLICPKCLSDKLEIKNQEIVCRHCGQVYQWPNNQPPNLIVFERLPQNQQSRHQPSAGTDLTLDVGAGANQSGTINIDIRPLKGIDVVCNALYLPFRDHSFSKVIHNQVLEHFSYEDALTLLKEINRVLKPDGILEFWTPNFQALGILQAWLTSPICYYYPKIPTIYPPLGGVQDYPENVHLSQWNRKLVAFYTRSSGFKMIKNRTEQEYLPRHRLMKLIVWLTPNRRGQIHYVGRK